MISEVVAAVKSWLEAIRRNQKHHIMRLLTNKVVAFVKTVGCGGTRYINRKGWESRTGRAGDYYFQAENLG